MKETNKIKLSIIIEALLLLAFPVTLFTFRILPPMWRYGIMEVALAILLVIIIRRKIGFSALGLRKDNFLQSVKAFMPGTIIITIGMLLAFFIKGGDDLWWDTKFFIYYPR